MPSIISTLLICPAFIFWTAWYGKTHLYRDLGSIFYGEKHAFEQKYSQHRRQEVDAFIRSQSPADPNDTRIRAGPKPKLCVAYSSVRRKNTQYLETSIGRVLQGLTPTERKDLLHLSILIAESNATTHPSYNSTWTRALVDVIHTYNISPSELSHLQSLPQTGNYAEKNGVYGYTYALNRCHDTAHLISPSSKTTSSSPMADSYALSSDWSRSPPPRPNPGCL